MKTFEQHILDISGCPTIEIADNAVSSSTMLNWAREAAKRYATQVSQDALNRAAENAEARIVRTITERAIVYVDKESINTQISLP